MNRGIILIDLIFSFIYETIYPRNNEVLITNEEYVKIPNFKKNSNVNII